MLSDNVLLHLARAIPVGATFSFNMCTLGVAWVDASILMVGSLPLPILDNGIESIAGEGPQSGVRRVVVASLKSRSCTVGHLRGVGRQGHKGEVLPLLWEVGVADRESQHLGQVSKLLLW